MKLERTIYLLIILRNIWMYLGCRHFKKYKNKYLQSTGTTIIKILNVTSAAECGLSCFYDYPGCLAANIIATNDVTLCEMTTGLSNEAHVLDDPVSILLVKNYDQCVEDLGFCLNGGTCQPTWTSARCHCPDRFQGDRCQSCKLNFQGDDCQNCSERFQGDGCTECSERFQEDDCTECSERFQGDGCTECSEKFQGDGCTECSERFQGDDCTECSERFQGDGCTECSERFQGDGCTECSERFQGDGCQQCSEGFQGDGCQQCSERFYGDDCDTCASGYYGNMCDHSFTRHDNTDCLLNNDLDIMHSNIASDYESCKQWRTGRGDCGGFVVWGSTCYFKIVTCKDDTYLKTNAHVNLKEMH